MGTSRNIVITVVLALLFVSFAGAIFTVRAQIPQHIWSQRFGDSGRQSSRNVTVDGSGNVVVTGYFRGVLNFGGDPLVCVGDADIFVVKFDASGNHIWSQRFGDADFQAGWSVAVDGLGNVIVVGYFYGAVDFGSGPLTSAGEADIFVAMFDIDGNHVWSKRFGDPGYQWGESVAVDSSGGVFATGQIWGTVDFGGGPLTSAGNSDVFIVKLDADGDHVWSRHFGDENLQVSHSVGIDGLGNAVITGEFYGVVDFGGGPVTSAGDRDIFVAKFDTDGNHIWGQQFGDALAQEGESVTVDGSGAVIVTGAFAGNVDFGGGPLSSTGGLDIFVVKIGADGDHLWSEGFGDADSESGRDVAVDGLSNVVVTGYFPDTLDFGGGPLVSEGDLDVFVAKFDAYGNHVWSSRFGNVSTQFSRSVAVDVSGNAILTGDFAGTVDFGGGPLTTAGNYDIFVAKFGPYPVPTLLQNYSTAIKEAGIEMCWRLAEAGKDIKFCILRAEAISTDFRELHNANIVQESLSFTFVDNSYKPGLTYRYRVDISDEDGRRTLFETEAITAPALSLALNQNYPNPFNPTTTISFVLPQRVDVNLSIYSVDGKLIKTLVDEALSDGFNEATWDGKNNNGNPVSSGVYMCRLKAGKQVLTKTLVLLK